MPKQSVDLGFNLAGFKKAKTYVRNGMRQIEIVNENGSFQESVVISRRENIYKLRDWLNENFPAEK